MQWLRYFHLSLLNVHKVDDATREDHGGAEDHFRRFRSHWRERKICFHAGSFFCTLTRVPSLASYVLRCHTCDDRVFRSSPELLPLNNHTLITYIREAVDLMHPYKMGYVMRGSGSTSAANPGRQGSWRLVASKPAPLPVNELFLIWLRDLKRHFVDLVKPVTLLPRVYQSCCRSRRSPWEIVYLPKTAKVKLGFVTNAILKSKSKLLIS